jgi:hypothetical protein
MNATFQIGCDAIAGTTAKPVISHIAGRPPVVEIQGASGHFLLKDAFLSAVPGI